MSKLLILPWLHLKQDWRVKELELIRWTRGAGLPGVSPGDMARIHSMLGMYRDIKGRPIQRATLARLGNRGLLDNLSDTEMQEAFDLVEIFAFSALANRLYFGSLGNYCNRDCFTMIAQGFNDARHVALMPRRRLGYATCGWRVDEIAVTIPVHCHYLEDCVLDEAVLNGLAATRRNAQTGQWAKWQSSISCYNWGNTDSDTVRWQAEWVLICGAFERLLGTKGKSGAFRNRFAGAFTPDVNRLWSQAKRSAGSEDARTAKRTVREVWIEEFCNQRGDFAHGKVATVKKAFWKEWEHLLLAAIVFPLLVKLMLQRERRYRLTIDDRAQINVLEAFAGSKSILLQEQDTRHHGDGVLSRLLNLESGRLRALEFEEQCRLKLPGLFGK